METIERKPETQTPTPGPTHRRGLLLAAAALVVAIIAASAVIGLLSGSTEEPNVGGSPVDIARSFVEARDAGDADTAIDLFAPDAVVDDLLGHVNSVEQYPALFDWFQAVDWRWTVGDCVQTATGPATEVVCTYTNQNPWGRALEVAPGAGSFDFVISEGQIQELKHNQSTASGWNSFAGWVRFSYPDDVDTMYDFSGPFSVAHLTPESIALWEQYTNEWLASLAESSAISSFEDVTGTYLRQGPGAPTYLLFLEDGTIHASPDTDQIVDTPVTIYHTRFAGTTVSMTTTDSICDQPDPGGSYEVHVLESGSLQFVALSEDTCALRSAVLQGFGNNDVAFEPIP